MKQKFSSFSASAFKVFPLLCSDIRTNWKPVAGFMTWFFILNIVVLSPLTISLLNQIVGSSGQVAISNEDLAGFALSFRGIAFILVVATVYIVSLQLQMGGLSLLAIQAIHGQPVSLGHAISESTRRLPTLLRLSAIHAGVAMAFVGLLGLILLIIKVTLLSAHDINFYLSERPGEWKQAIIIGVLATAVVGFVLAGLIIRWIVAVPIVLISNVSPRKALQESWQFTAGHWKSLAALVLCWWLGTFLLWALLAWIGSLIVNPVFAWAGYFPARVLPIVAFCVVVTGLSGWLWHVVTLSIHQFFITRFALDNIEVQNIEKPDASDHSTNPVLVKRAWIGLVAACLALGFTSWTLLSELKQVEDVMITAHRGSSVDAPENTLAAIRLAIEDGADYAEIDVQTTRDGVVVVIHDRDLMRVGANPGRIEDLTLSEIQEVNVGQRFSDEFAGETVPTLEQVIELARDRIKLNIELKYNRPDPDLIPKVVSILKETDFLDQVVITSLDASAVLAFKRAEPEAVIGLIVTAAIGRIENVAADFLSVAAGRATPEYIRRAHRANKQVHVWTVNNPLAMLQMIEAGADNIITDKPALLLDVIRERDKLSSSEKLALQMRVLFGAEVVVLTEGNFQQ